MSSVIVMFIQFQWLVQLEAVWSLASGLCYPKLSTKTRKVSQHSTHIILLAIANTAAAVWAFMKCIVYLDKTLYTPYPCRPVARLIERGVHIG